MGDDGNATVRLVGLSKSYGADSAVTDLHLAIPPGEVFGYLGPNGAGKTTTVRLLLGLLRPTAGRVEAFGLDAWSDAPRVHARTGYLPGDLAFYDRLTGRQTVDYYARLRGRPADAAAAATLAERLALDLDRRVGTLSKGNRQKLGLVQALMSGPDLIVLDEPTGGLDPLAQQEFHRLVREAADRGAAILLSSHVLDEVQRVADRVGIIRAGRLVAVEALGDLRAKALHRVVARLEGQVDASAFARIPGIRDLSVEDGTMHCGIPEGSVDVMVKTMARWRVADLSITEADLEEMFLALYGGAAADGA